MKSTRVLPKFVIHPGTELPQWIISSDRAAYSPFHRTVHLCKDWTLRELLHELGHHLICILGGKDRTQVLYDKLLSKGSQPPAKPDDV